MYHSNFKTILPINSLPSISSAHSDKWHTKTGATHLITNLNKNLKSGYLPFGETVYPLLKNCKSGYSQSQTNLNF
uniref:Uncharacterized protein n=1 Tax=Nelumbo nucifera TaxID=4432 RepID=A0A822XIW7_NELNU|nr:TPA_asm: hypothetical protein HUJ06_021405 [Nelumbo nucifera]